MCIRDSVWIESDPIDGLRDTVGQIVFGGQRLGGGQDAPALVLDQCRVGVGASGVDTQSKRQAAPPVRAGCAGPPIG